jgi:hypothetical protein
MTAKALPCGCIKAQLKYFEHIKGESHESDASPEDRP